MRDPLSIKPIDVKDGFEVRKMEDIPEFAISDYDLNDEKQQKKYFESIERLVRRSFEYQQFIKFLRETTGMNTCSIYENVSNEQSFGIKIHIHHHPFTLYDIVTIVFNKRYALHEDLSEELVAKEVLFLHYNLYVGLIPLSETVHELVHNSFLFIPLTKVFGAFKKFANFYIDYIPTDLQDLLDRNIEASEHYDENRESSNLHILDKHYVYLDLSGSIETPNYDQITKELQQKIYDMKNAQSTPLVKGITF